MNDMFGINIFRPFRALFYCVYTHRVLPYASILSPFRALFYGVYIRRALPYADILRPFRATLYYIQIQNLLNSYLFYKPERLKYISIGQRPME